MFFKNLHFAPNDRIFCTGSIRCKMQKKMQKVQNAKEVQKKYPVLQTVPHEIQYIRTIQADC